MFSQFLANFTWLDACIIFTIVGISYKAFHQGMLVEIFKLVGLLCAVIIGLHFYLRCGNFLNRWFAILGWVNYMIPYVALIGLTMFLFHLTRDGLSVLVKEGEISSISKVVGLMFGFFRALLLISLVLVGCLIVGNNRMTRFVRHTFTSRFLLKLTPKMYSKFYDVIIKPSLSSEPKNTYIVHLAEKDSKPIFDTN